MKFSARWCRKPGHARTLRDRGDLVAEVPAATESALLGFAKAGHYDAAFFCIGGRAVELSLADDSGGLIKE